MYLRPGEGGGTPHGHANPVWTMSLWWGTDRHQLNVATWVPEWLAGRWIDMKETHLLYFDRVRVESRRLRVPQGRTAPASPAVDANWAALLER